MFQIGDARSSIATFGAAAILGGLAPIAAADEPCGELDECAVRIEINASDGDIGFHVLFDAEGWHEARIVDPNGKGLFKEQAKSALKEQLLAENFFESTEPVCEAGLEEDEDDVVLTLPEFFERFPEGLYDFRVKLEEGGELAGTTELTHVIPAAPANLEFNGTEISWDFGADLGECTTFPEGFQLAGEGDILAFEVVIESEDDQPFEFMVRVPADTTSVTVPEEFLAALGPNAPVDVEVGAIERRPNGSPGNQTFTEEEFVLQQP